MKEKRLRLLLLAETLVICFLITYIFFIPQSGDKIQVNHFNRVYNKELSNIVGRFAKKAIRDDKFKFILIEDMSLNSDTVIYNITLTFGMGLVSNDLTFNVLCEDIDGYKVIFRPQAFHRRYFKSIDTLMVDYLGAINGCDGAVETLQELIEENKRDPLSRSTVGVTGPNLPRIIVMFNHDGVLISESEIMM